MNKIKIGLVGLGWMGSEHARNISANPKAELAAICDTEPANIRKFPSAAGFKGKVFKDYKAMLASRIDAVVIASPNALHAEMTVAAARAGKHIYCEKPMAITLADCRRVREAVTRAGVKYLIGYHRRLNPLYQYARRLLDEGRLGRPFMVESDYLHHVPGHLGIWSWLGKERIAGSLFHAGSGHNVDLIRYFCGDVTEVACMKDAFLPRDPQVETEDTALAVFRFKSGAIGKVQCCVGPILPFHFNFKLYGTKGTVLDNRVWLDDMPRFAEAGRESGGLTLPESWIPDNVQGGASEPWDKLMGHFIAMLTENAPCLNDVTSAYQTSLACFAAVEAARRKTVISIKDLVQK
ncbi:MAG: Gfo/Idh/MocA family oxidoreductase [Kiritimatiellae bacterium]|nr:Gfo/Idh/MocA family oxidoreductase [Kiritimatiellia bacterium]